MTRSKKQSVSSAIEMLDSLTVDHSPYYLVIGEIEIVQSVFLGLRYRKKEKTSIRFLFGWKMKTWQMLYDHCAAALQFPYFWGQNLNAFAECVADFETLAWIYPRQEYLILIYDMLSVLSEETDKDAFEALMDVFNDAIEECRVPWQEGTEVGRPAIPYHVVLHCEPKDKEKAIERMTSSKVAFEVIEVSESDLLAARDEIRRGDS